MLGLNRGDTKSHSPMAAAVPSYLSTDEILKLSLDWIQHCNAMAADLRDRRCFSIKNAVRRIKRRLLHCVIKLARYIMFTLTR